MDKLLPCPFCGGEATMDSSGKKYQVWCKRCSCIHMGEFYNTEAEAIAAWNQRAQPENEPLMMSGMREIIFKRIAYHCDERRQDYRLGKACVEPLINDIIRDIWLNQNEPEGGGGGNAKVFGVSAS